MIDEDDEVELDVDDARLRGVDLVKDIPRARKAQTRAVLRTVRRLEELEVDAEDAPKTGQQAKVRQRELVEAYEHELHTYDLLKASRPEWA